MFPGAKLPKLVAMNYLSHGLPYLRSPYLLAGTALPDLLSVVDRRVRLREKSFVGRVYTGGSVEAELATGARLHLHDDGWFHRTRAFVECTATIAAWFDGLLNEPDARTGFLGHVVTELLLDAALCERFPSLCDDYFHALGLVDPVLVTSCVERWTGQSVTGLPFLIRGMCRDRPMASYVTDEGLLRRLNQVLRRVKLRPLPEGALGVFAQSRPYIRNRAAELLPPAHYPIDLTVVSTITDTLSTGDF